MIVPVGFLNPINFTAALFRTIPKVSVENAREKSLPCWNFQPTVFPKSCVTQIVANSPSKFGSFLSHSKPLLVDQTPVGGLDDSAISTMAPEFFRSVRSKPYFP